MNGRANRASRGSSEPAPVQRRKGAWLFVPGSDRKKLEKARSLSADVIIIDWEDGVHPSAKSLARSNTRESVRERRMSGRIAIRVNSAPESALNRDLAEVQSIGPDVLILPKAEDPEVVKLADSTGRKLVLLIESARGLERIAELVEASAHVERLALGGFDFLRDVGADVLGGVELLDYARSRLVIASRALGLAGPIDSVHGNIAGVDALSEEARQARRFGFAGKLAVHPSQLESIESAFLPSRSELEWARAVITAAGDERRRGAGAFLIDGILIDRPILDYARALLETDGPG